MAQDPAPRQAAPTFSDAIGADLLTATARQDWRLKERHDSLEFLNHAYLKHDIRLTLSLTGADELAQPSHDGLRALNSWRRETVLTSNGLMVVPIAALDRRARATPQIRNENGDAVHVLTSYELDGLFGGGLVAYASHIVGATRISPDLETYLRDIPRLANTLATAEESSDVGWARTQKALLDLDALPLLLSSEFEQVTRIAMSTNPLVVLLRPSRGPRRILTYSLERPLRADESERSSRNVVERVRESRGRILRRISRIDVRVPLGAINGCDRYVLEAEAPFDAWFRRAEVMSQPEPGRRVVQDEQPVDTSQCHRLSYILTARDERDMRASTVQIDLRAQYTGAVRASAIISPIVAAAYVAGLVFVCLSANNHQFLPSDSDSSTSLLLLCPGLAVLALSAPARHTLTATLQFPLRLLLWSLGMLSFAVALASGMRLDGAWNITVWAAVAALAVFIAVVVRISTAALRMPVQRRRRVTARVAPRAAREAR